MALEFGLRRGLAAKIDWNSRTNDLAMQYQLKKQAETEAAAKAKLYADDFDYNNAINSFDNPVIKEFARNKITEIGGFIRQNPDWETNISKRVQYKNMVKELKDNPDLMRGIQSDAAKREWDQWRVKNPELANSPEGKDYEMKWNNYLKTGNQDGVAGNPAPFMFTPPELFDDEKYIQDIYSKLPTKEYAIRGMGAGATRADVSDERAKTTALGLLRDPKVAYKMDAIWKNKLTDEQRAFWGDQVSWIAKRGQNYTKSELSPGQYFAPKDGGSGSGGAGAWSAFNHQIMQAEPGRIKTSPYLKALSPLVGEDAQGNGTLNTNDDLRVLYKTKDGKQDWKLIKGFNGRDVDATRTGEYMMYQGIPMIKMRVKLPLETDNSADIKSMFDHNYKVQFAADPYDELPEYSDVAKLELDKDGKQTRRAVVETWVPANADYGNQLEYDNMAVGQKQADAAYPGTVADRMMKSGTPMRMADLKAKKYTDAEIQDAVAKGVITIIQ